MFISLQILYSSFLPFTHKYGALSMQSLMSVCPSHSCTVSRGLKISSDFFLDPAAHHSSFFYSKCWLECRLWVPVHCLQSNGVIIPMTSRTLHNAATSWITYCSTFLAGSRGGALVGGLGDKVPQLKVVTRKFYAYFGSNSHNIWNRNTDYWKWKLRSTTPIRK